MSHDTDRFIEMMGRHLEEDGAPRIAGRLLGALMLNEKPCSLDDLTEQLQVSKGSVSSNARLLEAWGVADRVTIPGDRRDFYQVAENFGKRVLQQQIERNRLLLERLEVGEAAVADAPRRVQERLASVTTHVRETLSMLQEKLDQLERIRR